MNGIYIEPNKLFAIQTFENTKNIDSQLGALSTWNCYQ